MLEKRLSSKIVKFLIGGGVTTLFNLILIFLLIDCWGWNTLLLHNVANTVSIELSVLLSFFIYRLWVWTEGEWTIKNVLFKQIPLFHVAAGTVIAARIIFLFPLLDYFHVEPKINTLAGGLLGAALNYVMSDRLVFKTNNTEPETEIFSRQKQEASLQVSTQVSELENY